MLQVLEGFVTEITELSIEEIVCEVLTFFVVLQIRTEAGMLSLLSFFPKICITDLEYIFCLILQTLASKKTHNMPAISTKCRTLMKRLAT